MIVCDAFHDACGMPFGFRSPEPRSIRLQPQHSQPITRRCFRPRPSLYMFLEGHPEAQKPHQELKTESETVENFNENCWTCECRKQRKMAHHKSKVSVDKLKKQTREADPTPEVTKAKNIPAQAVEKADDLKFSLRLNVEGFEPDDLQVRIKDKWLEIDAKCEEKNESNGTYSFRQLRRRFALPDHVNPDLVKSFLNKDGYLSIEASPPESASASQQDDSGKAEPLPVDSTNSEGGTSVQAVSVTTEVANVANSSTEQCPAA